MLTENRYLKQAAIILRDKHNGDIPDTIEGLTSLPGVGPKMAHLCMSADNGWGRVEGIGVDVHVHRITNLWGWQNPPTKTPEETRLALQSWLPRDKWKEINWLLVGFGQAVCLPVGRKCGDCELGLRGLCKAAERKKVLEGRRRREETTTTTTTRVVKTEKEEEIKKDGDGDVEMVIKKEEEEEVERMEVDAVEEDVVADVKEVVVNEPVPENLKGEDGATPELGPAQVKQEEEERGDMAMVDRGGDEPRELDDKNTTGTVGTSFKKEETEEVKPATTVAAVSPLPSPPTPTPSTTNAGKDTVMKSIETDIKDEEADNTPSNEPADDMKTENVKRESLTTTVTTNAEDVANNHKAVKKEETVDLKPVINETSSPELTQAQVKKEEEDSTEMTEQQQSERPRKRSARGAVAAARR